MGASSTSPPFAGAREAGDRAAPADRERRARGRSRPTISAAASDDAAERAREHRLDDLPSLGRVEPLDARLGGGAGRAVVPVLALDRRRRRRRRARCGSRARAAPRPRPAPASAPPRAARPARARTSASTPSTRGRDRPERRDAEGGIVPERRRRPPRSGGARASRSRARGKRRGDGSDPNGRASATRARIPELGEHRLEDEQPAAAAARERPRSRRLRTRRRSRGRRAETRAQAARASAAGAASLPAVGADAAGERAQLPRVERVLPGQRVGELGVHRLPPAADPDVEVGQDLGELRLVRLGDVRRARRLQTARITSRPPSREPARARACRGRPPRARALPAPTTT